MHAPAYMHSGRKNVGDELREAGSGRGLSRGTGAGGDDGMLGRATRGTNASSIALCLAVSLRLSELQRECGLDGRRLLRGRRWLSPRHVVLLQDGTGSMHHAVRNDYLLLGLGDLRRSRRIERVREGWRHTWRRDRLLASGLLWMRVRVLQRLDGRLPRLVLRVAIRRRGLGAMSLVRLTL